MDSSVQVALFTPGYPHVDVVLRAIDLARRHGGAFMRCVGEPLAPVRDQFVRQFLDSTATHALLLEGDVLPPPDAVDRLLKVDAAVASAVYPQWADDRLVTNVQALTDSGWSARVPARVFPVRRCLLGCVLVRREAFATLTAPWFLSTMSATRFVADDEWFCNAVRRAGLRLLCDGGTVCTMLRQGADLLALTGGAIHQD